MNPKCFGEHYVTKLNEYVYSFTENPFGNFYENFWPEIYLTYMLMYMFSNDCGIDHLANDFCTYCWYRGCWPMQIIFKLGDKWLYILRSINDAGIVWKEGMQELLAKNSDYTTEGEEYAKLSTQTGQTLAEIFQDVTGFYPVSERDFEWEKWRNQGWKQFSLPHSARNDSLTINKGMTIVSQAQRLDLSDL